MVWWCRCLRNRSDHNMIFNPPRLPFRSTRRSMRGGWLALALVAGVAAFVAPAGAEHRVVCVEGDGAVFRTVCFTDAHGPERYGHGVLGDTPEWDAMSVRWGAHKPAALEGRTETLVQDPKHVFEDIAPRVQDLDGDGVPEIIVVQSRFDKGARLVVFRAGDGLEQAATPYIGTRNRWLAPVGAADLDGDGHIEIAYVDRPHLAKTLRVWRYRAGAVEPVASLSGLSNHRIGEPFITGGIRDCGAGPEMITADATWGYVMATRLVDGQLETRALGTFGPDAIDAALAC